MSSDLSGNEILLQQLVDLLGFEDGASDVLEHLLSIGSDQDLMDYLHQLLGSDNGKKLQKLVKDIEQFKSGGKIELPAAADGASLGEARRDVASGIGQKEQISNTNMPKKALKTKTPPRQTKQAPKPPPRQKQAVSTKVATVQMAKSPALDRAPSEPREIIKQTEPAQVQEQEKEKPVQKSQPPRGKPKFICGCYGNFHKPLTNCLFCGRVSCEKEGYDFCPYCGHLVERVVGGGSDPASRHRDRLLCFDREYARRTVVLDDQADFFVNEQSLNWMASEEERQQYLAAESERAEQAGRHPKMKLELNI